MMDSTPRRWSMSESSRPAGPAPTIPTCVRIVVLLPSSFDRGPVRAGDVRFVARRRALVLPRAGTVLGWSLLWLEARLGHDGPPPLALRADALGELPRGTCG